MNTQERILSGLANNYQQKALQKTIDRKDAEADHCTKLKIETCIKFLSLAHYIDLLGAFDSVVNIVKDMLTADPKCFKPEHLLLVMDLPSDHGIRVLFLGMAAKGNIEHLLGLSSTLAYHKELKKLPGFKEEMAMAFAEAFSKKTDLSRKPQLSFQIASPLGEDEYKLTARKLRK